MFQLSNTASIHQIEVHMQIILYVLLLASLDAWLSRLPVGPGPFVAKGIQFSVWGRCRL